MTMEHDGGQAFPSPKSSLMRDHSREPHRFTHDIKSEGGMSLRDWFAGQALAGLMSYKAITGIAGSSEILAERERKAISCYLLADAMLAARVQS